MLKTEMIARQTSLLEWIKAPANKCNPNLNKVAIYWLKLTALIHNIKIEDVTLMKTTEHAPQQPDLVETTEAIKSIEVIDAITIN